MSAQTTLELLRIVSDETNVSIEDLLGRSRAASIASARQLGYWLFSSCGYSQISTGRVFGRDHSTVAHGVAAVINQRRLSAGVREQTNRMFTKATTQSGPGLIDTIIERLETIRSDLVELKGVVNE